MAWGELNIKRVDVTGGGVALSAKSVNLITFIYSVPGVGSFDHIQDVFRWATKTYAFLRAYKRSIYEYWMFYHSLQQGVIIHFGVR